DTNGAINPAAQEICDGGVDNDCDGQSDDNDASVTGQGTYYTDSDNDGYGAGASFLACVQPALSSTIAGDCNDTNGAINPAAQEICDGGVDNDCDGQSDDNDASVTGQGTYYTDSDNDGYGAGASFLACVQPASSSTVAGDCSDTNGAINPAAQEICDGGVDNDCDGQSDDNDASVIGQGTYYTDSDNDGYGAGASFLACVQPALSSTVAGDCNDTNGAINPAAQEICDGGVDNDCDGQSDDNDASVTGQGTYYADSDNDGFGSSAVIRACIQPAGTVLNGNDCNDNNAAINPSATEVCNGADDDCDGQTDEGTVPALGAISGTASACVPLSAGTAIFSISSVPGVSTYTWTPPTGMTISAGQGTTSITITWTSSAVHTGIIGSLSVTGSTACGATVPSTMNISYNISSPVRPLSISGPIKICPGDTAVFSIATVARASAYTWTMPAGMQIVNGQGGRIILATAVSGFVGGNIDVVASNACGNSPVRSKTMSQNLLLAPGTITGPVAGLCGQTGITYSVPVLTGTFGYIWYVPAGATIVSGQGTTSIVVNFPSAGFNQSFVSVQGYNACGNGTLRTLAVSGVPAIPGAVSGPAQVCPNSTNVLYEVPALSGASTYTWTAPAGSTIASGQGTRTVYLNYGPTSGTNLTLTVVASNACGIGSPRILGGIAVSSAYCTRVAAITGTQVKGLSVYPNPATDRIVVSFEADGERETQVLITDLLGRKVYGKRTDSINGINRQDVDVSQLQAGTYQLTVISGEAVSVQTIVIE
ncbi:MAG: MopE-related protein, partial [Bacteroidota bacterium]